MNCLLLSAVLIFPAFAQETAQPAKESTHGKMSMVKLDGDWTAVYVEMDGRKVDNKDFAHVTIKNNVVTCKHDGKEKSWKLQFGPHNMVRSTEIGGTAKSTTSSDSAQPSIQSNSKGMHTHHGVYIASQDYFCISLNKGMDHRGSGIRKEDGKESKQPRTTDKDGVQREQTTEVNQPGSAGSNDRFQGSAHGSGLVIILHRTGSTTSGTEKNR